MTLFEQIKGDVNQALKANESLKVEVLRGLLSAIHNREIELRGKGGPARNAPLAVAGELTEEEIILVLGKEAKKRKEAAEIYTKAGRQDLGDKEIKELDIIKAYLPSELSETEIEAVVRKIVDQGTADFGKVMGAVMKEVAGRAQAGVVKGIVERVLETRQ